MPKDAADTVTTTIRLPRALVEAIDDERLEAGLTRNGMIAVLLREALSKRS